MSDSHPSDLHTVAPGGPSLDGEPTAQPMDHTVQPMDHTAQPMDHTAQPMDHIAQPINHTAQLLDPISQPTGIQESDAENSLDTVTPYNAVTVSGVYRGYGSGRRKISVLRDLDMTVRSGTIYGLLGPSGCGKTTLLRCILGRLKVSSGEVMTLGKHPGSQGHEVPGRRVGYMPQELALFNRFTIGETLSYFGRLHQMTKEHVAKRTKFLIDFLSLPEQSRLIEQCSGGQQRRTSFAIALLQEPELLVLDEPTVGVDPLLRKRIWEHLLTISRTHVTIIITTHYVEEARQAHTVGLMRNGRLLAEAPPDELMQSYQLPSLEDVFLHLCEHDKLSIDDTTPQDIHKTHNIRRRVEPSSSIETRPLFEDEISIVEHKDAGGSRCCRGCSWWPQCHNIVAQAIKNFLVLRRNIGFLLFEFFLPALQITLFCVCIGREPMNLPLGIVNNETCTGPDFCGSNDFLSKIDNHTFIQVNHNFDLQGALHEVKIGQSWGVVNIGENFTEDFIKRMMPFPVPSNKTLEGSKIHLHLDMTNQQISMTIQAKMLESFQSFTHDLLVNLSSNPAIAEIPLKIEEPVYGEIHPSFTNFMAPGIILSITYFMATGLTALAFVLERKQGLLDRSMVAGVSTMEIMLGHICTQFGVMMVQVGLLLIFALGIFQVPYQGSLILVIILPLLQGLTGMTMGLFVSAMCEEETSAIQCALGMVYPNLLLSGIIWPIQSMPKWLKYISYCLPMTYAAEAMRSVLSRGWDLTYTAVWSGYMVTIAWGIGMILLSAIVLKVKGK